MPKITIKTIDFSDKLDAIRSKFGVEYHRNPNSHKEAAALWGVEANDSGVTILTDIEPVLDSNRCQAEIRYCRTSKGYWLIGISCDTNISGIAYYPSVWNSLGFHSQSDARIHGLLTIAEFFKGENRPDTLTASKIC